MRYLVFLLISGVAFSCSGSKKAVTNTSPKPPVVAKKVPVITFDGDFVNFGDVKLGEKREHIFSFTNTGNADLIIELVTACTCTELDWPREVIPPGGRGAVRIVFDSATKKGKTDVDVDVIANTDPIVVTAQFTANVVLHDK